MFSDEELALIEAIHDDPRNDAPRLAYADWREPHDLSGRPSLIRLQCQHPELRAGWPRGTRRWIISNPNKIKSDFGELIRCNGKAWLKPIPQVYGVSGLHWDRGMPTIGCYVYGFDFERVANQIIAEFHPHQELELIIALHDYNKAEVDWRHPVFSRAKSLVVTVCGNSSVPFRSRYADDLLQMPRVGKYTELILPRDDHETLDRVRATFGEWPGYMLAEC